MEKTYYKPIQTVTVKAGSNLTNLKRFVKISSGVLTYCGAKEKSLGVLEVETDSGQLAPVVTIGCVLVEVGSGGITENTLVTSDATGKAIAISNVSVAAATGAVAVLADAANPTITLTGGILPEHINGMSLDTVSAGGFARILLK